MTNENPRGGMVSDAAHLAIEAVDKSTDLAVAVINAGVDTSQDVVKRINDLKKQLLDELGKLL